MDLEKISEFIKNARLKSHLSQEKFGEKYGVTYQAVSKWETGKNLPDISILKEICKDYDKNINELLTNQKNTKKKYIFLGVPIVLCLLIIACFVFFPKKEDEFEFKTITTTCDNFELFGSMAYNSSKTSIYISNITYCGKENHTVYDTLECTLYESFNNQYTVIDSSKDEKKTIDEFLTNVQFHIDHYSESCQMYKENGIFLEIKATDSKGEVTYYQIPLTLEDNCISTQS